MPSGRREDAAIVRVLVQAVRGLDIDPTLEAQFVSMTPCLATQPTRREGTE
jgi:hypothetical protein